MNPIDSHGNPKFKIWQSLLGSKGLKKEGLFLLSGEKLVHEYLRRPTLELVAELVPKSGTKKTQDRSKIFELAHDLFKELDELGTHSNILVLKTPPLESWSEAQPANKDGLEIFSPLGDPGNLGALIRNAEAFGAKSVILTQEAANPFLPKAVKASAGSVLKMNLLKGPALKDLPPGLIVLDGQGKSLPSFTWPRTTRLLVGEEGVGSQNYSGGVNVRIPTLGVESLNASVAVGIALYDRQCKILKLPKSTE